MFFLLFALISLITVLESLLVYFFKLPELTTVPMQVYVILLAGINFILYKVKYKNLKVFRFAVFRAYINAVKLTKRVDKKINVPKGSSYASILQHQEKAIKLWRACLRNKDSQLSSSITTSERQIVRNNIMIILTPNDKMGSTMIIFDIDQQKRCLYEVEINSKTSPEVCNFFDLEMQKRMRNAETARRMLIDEDLDKLIRDEEEISVKKKMLNEGSSK